MSGAPIRAAIVVAAIVAGALVLSLGFPASGKLIGAPPSGGSSPSITPTPSASRSTTPPPSKPTGRVQGVVLAIFNTTSVVGLAACAGVDLSKLGYVVPASSVLQAPPGSSTPETEIFFRNGQGKADAHLLAQGYFKGKDVKARKLQKGTDVSKHAELVIFLGTQYAASHQGGC